MQWLAPMASPETQPLLARQNSSASASEARERARKTLALVCALCLTFGSHYCSLALTSLKKEIIKDLGITNAAYGIIQSAQATVNTILPLLGGLFLDAFGMKAGSMLSSSFVTMGAAITAYAAYIRSYPILVLGRAIYGLGSGTVVVAQQTILANTFSRGGLSFAFGLELTVARLGGFLAQGTVVPIAQWAGHYSAALVVSFLICLFSLLINVIYIVVDRMLMESPSIEEAPTHQHATERKSGFRAKYIWELSYLFWVICVLHSVLYGCWTTFLHINTDLIQSRFPDHSPQTVAWEAATSQFFPIVAAPLLGSLVDHYGYRSLGLTATTISFVIAIILIGYTHVHPILSMTVFAFSQTLGALCALGSVPLIAPSRHAIGTSLGTLKSFSNSMAGALDPILGRIQDATPGHTYDRVIIAYICIGCVAFLIAVAGVWTMNVTMYNSVLDHGRKQLAESADNKNDDGLEDGNGNGAPNGQLDEGVGFEQTDETEALVVHQQVEAGAVSTIVESSARGENVGIKYAFAVGWAAFVIFDWTIWIRGLLLEHSN
ncbi:major facilitator superfamily domain-containing protein [Cladochytrium replicatum]|nr:major facilitator superfamily domain-containing protein [Cladochytrium replicatum]